MGAFLLNVPKYYSLVRHAQPTVGIVKSKERENHMSVWFEYTVDGHLFKSAGRAGDIGRTFDSIQNGEAVTVYYDQSNPASATMGEPSKYLNASIRGTCFIFTGLMLCSLLYELRKKYKVLSK